MRYWYDTEFIEDGKTVDLISIGIVAEDGREYYAISTEFNPKKASEWVKENVLRHLPLEEARHWKSREQIKANLLRFIGAKDTGWVGDDKKPELWGYYSAYDHVVLCQLFGTMMELPKGWPMYTRDLKQWCDSLGNPDLPKQDKGEHHALADAKWNRRAWEFLKEIETKK